MQVVVKKKNAMKGGVGLGRGQGFRNPKAEAAPDERLYTVKSVLDGKWMLAIEEAGVCVG